MTPSSAIANNTTQQQDKLMQIKKACEHVDYVLQNDFEILRGTQLLSRDRKNQS